MLRIGIAGIGFMGMIHYLAAQRAAGVKVVAIQSRDSQKRAGDWRGIRGNFGPPGAVMDLSGVHCHETFEPRGCARTFSWQPAVRWSSNESGPGNRSCPCRSTTPW